MLGGFEGGVGEGAGVEGEVVVEVVDGRAHSGTTRLAVVTG